MMGSHQFSMGVEEGEEEAVLEEEGAGCSLALTSDWKGGPCVFVRKTIPL
jgi:hypothetical protein